MDAFSEILGGVALKGALFFSAEFSAPWGFSSPPSRNLAPALAPGAPHLVIFHFVIEGSGLVRLEDGSKLRLEAGDVIVLPQGAAWDVQRRRGSGNGNVGAARKSSGARSDSDASRRGARSPASCAGTWPAIPS